MMRKKVQLVFLILAAFSPAGAQMSNNGSGSPLTGVLQPGQTLRYEIETNTSYSADVVEGYSTTVPLGPCQYSIGAEVALTADATNSEGNIVVRAAYQNVRLTHWNCDDLDPKQLEKKLREFAASAPVYQVGPHGEVANQNKRDRFTYLSAVDLLNRVALDLLQTRLSDGPVSQGSLWKPHGQFTYWKDYLLSGLELSGTTMRWKSTPKIVGRDYDFITSKYVFAPTESSSGPVTAGGSLRQKPTNVVAGVLDVSLLFDPREQHISWLNRHYVVENHVSVQPEEEPDPEVLTIRWEEEATARLIPEKDSIAWLAGLKDFESTPESGTKAAISKIQRRPPAAAKKRSAAEIETLDFTPHGFTRWERKFCDSSWYCSEISIALPGETRVADDSTEQTAYLSRVDGSLLTVTVGPVLVRKFRGLTPDEELQKQSDFYLANQVWMANKPGITIESQSTSVDGYSARVTTFRGERRDLAGIRGQLLMLLSPWGEAFPITCSVDQGEFAKLQATCECILGLVRLRRPEE